jgi:hypothetical protein
VKEVYTYFRLHDSETIMVVINNSREKQNVDLTPFRHQLAGRSELLDLKAGRRINIASSLWVEIDPQQSGIFLVTQGSH